MLYEALTSQCGLRMQNTHNDVREVFSSSIIKSPTDFSDIVRRSMTTYVGEAAANRDYSRGVTMGPRHVPVTDEMTAAPLNDQRYNASNYRDFLTQFSDGTPFHRIVGHALPQAVFNDVLWTLMTTFSMRPGLKQDSAYDDSVGHRQFLPTISPSTSQVNQILFGQADEGQINLCCSLVHFSLLDQTEMAYYALQYSPDSEQFELTNLGDDSSAVNDFHTEFLNWMNGTENRAYLSFSDIMTYCRAYVRKNPDQPCFLPISSIFMNCVATPSGTIQVRDISALHPSVDADLIAGYDPMIASSTNQVSLKNDVREHALFKRMGQASRPSSFLDHVVRGRHYTGTETQACTHDAYSAREDQLVEKITKQHVAAKSKVHQFLESMAHVFSTILKRGAGH